MQVEGCIHSCGCIVLLVVLFREGDLHAVLAPRDEQSRAAVKIGRELLGIQSGGGQN